MGGMERMHERLCGGDCGRNSYEAASIVARIASSAKGVSRRIWTHFCSTYARMRQQCVPPRTVDVDAARVSSQGWRAGRGVKTVLSLLISERRERLCTGTGAAGGE